VKASAPGPGGFILVNTTAAFNAAVGLGPDIITNSWSRDRRNPPLTAADQVLAAAVANAVASGIIVVFSAGNGRFGFPGQHPDVISAGGVYLAPDGSLTASNYASGFVSLLYSGRNSPDLCGLVGLLPRAMYIMLPLQEGCEIDQGNAGGSHPNGDETGSQDGWAAFSGTSAAAPQLAGVAALIKEACPRLTPAEVRDVMRSTARDVTTGSSHPNTGGTAGTGFDTATGAGLVDAHRAVLMAKVRCITGPRPPIRVLPPIEPPIRPPIEPIQPPIRPVEPVRPIQPIRPIAPVQPVRPIQPIRPVVQRQAEAAGPVEGEARSREGAPITEEDMKDYEEMIKRGDLDDTNL
jgi:subtilisin family serine protease